MSQSVLKWLNVKFILRETWTKRFDSDIDGSQNSEETNLLPWKTELKKRVTDGRVEGPMGLWTQDGKGLGGCVTYMPSGRSGFNCGSIK